MSDRLGSLKLLFPKLEILVPRRGTVVSLCGNWSFCVWKLEFLTLETKVSELDDEIAKNATSYSKLAELTKEKEDVERQLEEKMERWEYLNDLAEKIEKQKQ